MTFTINIPDWVLTVGVWFFFCIGLFATMAIIWVVWDFFNDRRGIFPW